MALPELGFEPIVFSRIDRIVLCWLVTVDAVGAPNVSPKEVFCACGASRVLVANIASPQSDRNLRGNPQVCLSFVEVFVQKGYKLKGTAEVVRAQLAQTEAGKAALSGKKSFQLRQIMPMLRQMMDDAWAVAHAFQLQKPCFIRPLRMAMQA